jgi:hypothetical protein
MHGSFIGKFGRISLAFVVAVALTASAFAQVPGDLPANVLTWQNDNHRTGRNLQESILVPSLVSGGTFGQLCSAQLDGQVYAQPLVVTDVKIGGTSYPNGVVYVVTQQDTLYAINGVPGGATCSVLAPSPLHLLPILTSVTGQTNTAVDCTMIGGGGCPVNRWVGILGTPVISIGNGAGTIYLVTFSQDAIGNYYHFLHAIDIQTFQEVGGAPFRIAPPRSSPAQATAFSFQHIQRPGLLLADGYIDVTFSMIDGYHSPYPNGAVFGYNAANLSATPLYFQTSTGVIGPSNGGGIWQGGAAPAYGSDSTETNYIYLKTGNGTWDGSSNWGDSFLKLSPTTLTVPSGGYFTPADQIYRSNSTCTSGYQGPSPQPGDMDFGSGGVMLIPDLDLASWPYLAVSGDKEGGIWFNNRTAPATPPHVTSCDNSSDPCSCMAVDGVVQTYWTGVDNEANFGPVIHTSPAYWRSGGTSPTSYLYMAPASFQGQIGRLTRYSLCSTANSQQPIDTTCGAAEDAVDTTPTAVEFPFGVTPAISAASSTASDAILWAIWSDGSAAGSSNVAGLYAFDAADTTKSGTLEQLYASSGKGSTCASDAMTAPATKFSVPTVANGYVYVGAQGPVGNTSNAGMFYIFGPNRTCP